MSLATPEDTCAQHIQQQVRTPFFWLKLNNIESTLTGKMPNRNHRILRCQTSFEMSTFSVLVLLIRVSLFSAQAFGVELSS